MSDDADDDTRGSRGPGSAPDDPRSVDTAVYEQLRAIARERLARGLGGESLQATALVHEAWLRLADAPLDRVADREHFLAVAARSMRYILVDHARRRTAQRRDARRNAARVELDDLPDTDRASSAVLAVDEALRDLAAAHARPAEVFELRHFGGLSVAETAAALGVSEPTVKRAWRFARAWLADRLEGVQDPEPGGTGPEAAT